MNRAGLEGEGRLMHAMALWVRKKVEEGLPANMRGIHSPRAALLDPSVLSREVRATMDGLVEDLTKEVKDAVPAKKTRVVAPGFTDRLSVMDNEDPCNECQEVTRVAVLDYQDGKCVAVNCESCAPEFRRGQ